MTDQRNLTNSSFHSFYPTVILLSLLLTGGFLTANSLFNKHLRQYKSAKEIPQAILKKQWLYGKVTSVGDGDNFHFFHTPSGVFGGWGWIRAVPELQKTSSETKPQLQPVNWWDKIFGSDVRNYKKHFLSLHVPYKGRRS